MGLETLAVFTRQLSAMVDAGIPLPRALQFYSEAEPTDILREVVGKVADAVFTGKSFSRALRDHPETFSEVFVALIESAEESGRIAVTLQRLADLLEKQLRLSQKVTSTLAYPAILVVVCCLCTALFVFGVFPLMLPMFAGMPLPWPTQLLIAGTRIFGPASLILLGLAVTLRLGRRAIRAYLVEHPRLRSDLSRMPLGLPVIGAVIRQVLAARLLYALATMLEAGLSMSTALTRAGAAAGNFWVQEQMLEVKQQIVTGETVARAFDYSQVFPSGAVQLIAVAEESSSLTAISQYLAKIYDEEAEMALSNLANVLEPLLMGAMGVSVGFVLVAAMLPTIAVIDQL